MRASSCLLLCILALIALTAVVAERPTAPRNFRQPIVRIHRASRHHASPKHNATEISPVRLPELEAAAAPAWKLCPGAPTHITTNNVTLTLANRNLGLTLNGKVDEQLQSGSFVTIDVLLGGTKIFSENIDMSQGTTLPVGPGPIVFSYSVSIPSIAPSGNYQVNLTFNDQNANPLACLQVTFTI